MLLAKNKNKDFFSWVEYGNAKQLEENIYNNSSKKFLKRKFNINQLNSKGDTALICSIYNQDLDVFLTLIKNNADVNCPNKAGDMPITIAMRMNNMVVFKLLLLNCVNKVPVLTEAIFYGYKNFIIEIINSGIDLNYKNENGESFLLMAIRQKDIHTVKLLLDAKVKVNDYNFDNETPLLLATRLGEIEIVKILLIHNADANLTDKKGYSPLMIASQLGRIEIIETLLYRKYLPENIKFYVDVYKENLDGDNALSLAFKHNQIESVKLFLSNMKDINWTCKKTGANYLH